eukprot:CAMPEP_0182831332 /NCGR_PEP_ID=MMETSP0006_2-20121128/19069_1 /TAXON_ID=97485 /ORGANISM="Prymnesium parvum, Strain Texoma1" /LENGTH=68 /DNA_ID=CAMNT_0024958993 /DNA_START=119 /DNA_END=326 /DNA_ORIENTATION=+
MTLFTPTKLARCHRHWCTSGQHGCSSAATSKASTSSPASTSSLDDAGSSDDVALDVSPIGSTPQGCDE